MDLRYLLPPLIKLLLPSFHSHPHLTFLDHHFYILLVLKFVFSLLIAIGTILFLFFSVKLSHNKTLKRVAVYLRGRNFSVLVALSLFCSLYLSPLHFWMGYPLILCLSPWEILVCDLMKWVFNSLYHILDAIPDLTIICITQQEVEAEVEGHTGQVQVNLEDEAVVVLIDDD